MALTKLTKSFAAFSAGVLAMLPLAPFAQAESEADVSIQPANTTIQQQAPLETEIQPIGKLTSYDLRNQTDEKLMEDAPFAASRNRVAVILYGENPNIKTATESAISAFIGRVGDVSYIWAKDNNADARTSSVGIYGSGRYYSSFEIGDDASQREIAVAILTDMKASYDRDVVPDLNTQGHPAH